MNPNFGTIFGVPLVYDRVTSYQYVPPSDRPMKAVLISDCHIGAQLQTDIAVKLFIDTLNALVSNEDPTVVFILGDLIDGTQSEALLKVVLTELEKLPVPVYAIGGNHDREFFSLINWPKNSNVKIFQELAIQITAQRAGKPDIKAFLAHDLLNNYRVRDPHAYFFVSWIKDGCKQYIKPDDWLITGHTHCGFLSNASRIACIGQFSPEIKAFGYATLQFNQDLVLSIKNSLKSTNFR